MAAIYHERRRPLFARVVLKCASRLFSNGGHRRATPSGSLRHDSLPSFPRALVALWLLLFTQLLRAQVVELDEVISREFSVHIGGVQTPDIKEIVSRETSLYIENGPAEPYSQVISREFSVVVDAPGAPPQVTGYSVMPSPTGATVTLNWGNYNQWAVKDVAYYCIYRSNQLFSSVTGMEPALVVPGETLQATLTDLPQWQDHFFAIVAVDGLENANPSVIYSAAYVLSPETISREVSVFIGAEPVPPYREVISREISVVVNNPGPPAPVSDFNVVTSPDGSTVTLNWSGYNQWEQKDVALYRVYYADQVFSSLAGVPFIEVPGENFTTTFTGLTPWVDHYYAVVPVDAGGASSSAFNYSGAYVISPEVVSREVAVFIGEEPSPPLREVVSREFSVVRPDATTPAPVTGVGSGFTATTARTTYGAIRLDWPAYNEWAQSDVRRYRIYVGPAFFSSVAGMTPYAFSADGTQSAIVADLTPETIYYAAVVAEDVLGNFNPVVYAASAKSSVGALGNVANLTAAPAPTTITYNWDLGGVGDELADFVREFRIYFNGATTPQVLAPALRTWTAIGLTPETAYSLRVTTVDLLGSESAGATVNATTLAIPAGTVDGGFTADANGRVNAIALQPDGKIVLGGEFTALNGVTRQRLARLLPDGTLESGFSPSISTGTTVFGLTVLPDGKLIVAGTFTAVNGVARNNVARLLPDGTLDAAWNPNANAIVRGAAPQPDGKIVLAGDFTTIGGVARNNIARLNADGTLDTGFNPNANGILRNAVLLPDGKLIIHGSFTAVGGVARNRIARLNPNGTLDTTFNPNASDVVYAVLPQPDGKLLLGGAFTTIGGVTRNRLARLNADGSLDTAYNPDAGSTVYSLVAQTDGRVLAGGLFTTVAGIARNRLARLLPDGALDAGFNPNANADVFGVALLTDGRILAAGTFTSVGGVTCNRLARLHNHPAGETLTVAAPARIEWLRSGTSPEVQSVTFEFQPAGGTAWTPLGAGSRIAGGWERTGLTLAASGAIRARARTYSGMYSSSGSLLESIVSYTSDTPLEAWKRLHLGDPLAPDLGDPDADGNETLLEYGLGLLPTRAEGSPIAGGTANYAGGPRLRLMVPRDPAHPDITVEVQASANAQTWTTVASSVAGAPFSGPGYVGGDSATPGLKTVEIRDVVPVSSAVRRFLRVKVTR